MYSPPSIIFFFLGGGGGDKTERTEHACQLIRTCIHTHTHIPLRLWLIRNLYNQVQPPQWAIFRKLATVIDYFTLLITACHRWRERTSSRTIHQKEPASSCTCFTPTRFYIRGSQVSSAEVHPGVHACGFCFISLIYAHIHTHARPIMTWP